MIRTKLAIASAAFWLAGCASLNEWAAEQEVARVERERLAALPLAEAPCVELYRRADRAMANLLSGTNAAYYRAATDELTIRCWIPELGTAPCNEVQRRADRAGEDLLSGTNAPFYRVAVVVLQERCW